MAAIQPMEQFLVHRVVQGPQFSVPGIGVVDLSITNSVLFMLLASAVIVTFFLLSARRALVPGRAQALAEMMYGMIDEVLTGGIIGDRGRPFLPFIFTLFSMIAVMNLLGLMPLGFTVTSQLAVTGTLAVVTFGTVLAVGFARNGLGFFKLFWPTGMPLAMSAFLMPIELLSFLIRPFTLALRLFGNMLGGHVVVYIFASFVIGLGAYGLSGLGLNTLGLVGSGMSFAMVVALTALDFVIAIIQAFVWSALACVYLNEVVNLDHGH